MAAGAWIVLHRSTRPAFEFRQLTFRRGQVGGARFAPDGQGVLYSATWGNEPRRLFVTYPASPESRALGFDDLGLMSVSRSGELALTSSDGTLPIAGSTLSRVPMNGGAPLPIERNVMSADWLPEGNRLAIARAVDGVNQLEFPVGTPIERTPGWIGNIRVSSDGASLAFVEHPVRNDTLGTVKLAERGREVRTLTGEWTNIGGLAWHPSGNEIWFTASRGGGPKSLWAVTISGQLRPVLQTAGTMTLRDIAPDGRALLSRETEELEMAAVIAGESTQRNLSWLDWSRVADVSADGRLILFDESGVAVTGGNVSYVRRMDDNSTMRLGAGVAMALSPDGKFALVQDAHDRSRLRLLPLDGRAAVDLAPAGLEYQWVRYFPDGRRLLALANEQGHPLRLYVQPLNGKPYPITPPAVARNVAIAPDGIEVAVFSANTGLMMYPTSEEGQGRPVKTTGSWAPLLWADSDVLYVQQIGAYTQIPTRIARLHLQDGRLEPWKEVAPIDALGVNAITKVMLSGDARTAVFNYRRVLSELFVAIPTS
jgi:WD40 repeat protein